MDFKNIHRKLKVLSNVYDYQKENRHFGKENHRLNLGVKNLWKIYWLAIQIFLLCDFHLCKGASHTDFPSL
jgi:hypothetical protein